MSDFLQRLPEFVGNHLLLSLLFVALLIALLVTEVMKRTSKLKSITPADLTLLINREDAVVFDLSSHSDFGKGHIPGSRNLAAKQFGPENKEVSKVKDQPVVVVCKDGRQSVKAAQQLVKAGFARVYTLGGGISTWTNAQLPVATGNK